MARRGRPTATPTARGDWADLSLATAIARRYYLDDHSKVDIAKEFELSRFQVARLLQEARERGVVHIEIGRPGQADEELGERLADALGLERAVVVSYPPEPTDAPAIRHVGRALSTLLTETVQDGDTIGLAWSRPVASMATQLEWFPRCTAVQLAGHLHVPGDTLGNVELVRRVAEAGGGQAMPIYVPMFVPDARTATALRKQPEIAAALKQVKKLQLAVVSIGGWHAAASGVYDCMSTRDRRAGATAGACGEISGRLFDRNGDAITDVFDDRVVGVTLDEIRRVPEVIAVSHDAGRAEAVVTAVRAGLASTLVTDESLAREALRLIEL